MAEFAIPTAIKTCSVRAYRSTALREAWAFAPVVRLQVYDEDDDRDEGDPPGWSP